MSRDEAISVADRTRPAFLEGVHLPPWMTGALCAQIDHETWFPDKGGSVREAKSICARCPVAAECLAWALGNPDSMRFGIYGGTTPRERAAIARERRGAA